MHKFSNLESRSRISSLESRRSLDLEGYGLDYITAKWHLGHGHHNDTLLCQSCKKVILRLSEHGDVIIETQTILKQLVFGYLSFLSGNPGQDHKPLNQSLFCSAKNRVWNIRIHGSVSQRLWTVGIAINQITTASYFINFNSTFLLLHGSIMNWGNHGHIIAIQSSKYVLKSSTSISSITYFAED